MTGTRRRAAHYLHMTDILGYFAMATGIVAAIMVSANFGRRATGYGFVVFSLSSAAWFTYGIAGSDPPLVVQNLVLAVINVIGIYRWLIVRGSSASGTQPS